MTKGGREAAGGRPRKDPNGAEKSVEEELKMIESALTAPHARRDDEEEEEEEEGG